MVSVLAFAAAIACALCGIAASLIIRYLTRGEYNPLDVLALLAWGGALTSCLSAAMAAIVVGIIALVHISRIGSQSGSAPRGRWMAITAIATGILPVAAYGVILILQ